jgi:ribosomal protein S18 acetylase RimI-like enzyme
VTSVRRATAADAAAIGQLLHDFNTEYADPTPPPDAVAGRMRELMGGDDMVVLLVGAGPDGLAVLRFWPSIWSQALECYVAELYVVPGARGRGLGRALMTEAVGLARGAGADYMYLATGETDMAARALYESLGLSHRDGTPDGPVNFHYDRPL